MNSAPLRIDVWFWSLDLEADEFEAVSALLSAEEHERAQRFAMPLDRRRWVASRGRMRQILGRITGVAPTVIAFGKEANGRPIFTHNANGLPSFNLSHSEGMAALAASYEARIGVDIEFIRPLTLNEMAWPLSEAEQATLATIDEPERTRAFFRYWTLKEAFIKAVGTGVSLPLEDFDISPPGLGAPRLLRLARAGHDLNRWRFAEDEPVSGYFGAVAAFTDGRDIRVVWHKEC